VRACMDALLFTRFRVLVRVQTVIVQDVADF